MAKSRNLYPQLLEFIRSSVADLKAKGHRVKLCGVYYHLGENDMSWHPFRRGAAERLQALVVDLRKDLKMRKLQWVVSQQQPTDDKDVNSVDVVADVAAVAAAEEAGVDARLGFAAPGTKIYSPRPPPGGFPSLRPPAPPPAEEEKVVDVVVDTSPEKNS